MLDKDPALNLLIRDADLELEPSDNYLKIVDNIEVFGEKVEIKSHSVFCLRSNPPKNHRVRGHILFLHDQTNTSSVWKQIRSLQTFSAFGYSCIAPDLPGMGKTGGAGVQEDCRAGFIDSLLLKLVIKEVIVVASSMSGQYIIPLLNNINIHRSPFHLVGLVAIGLSDTNQLCPEHLAQLVTPCLVLRGMFDTSIGLNASNVLSLMPHSRIVVVPNGRHLCHYSNPQFFHKVTLNFLDVVLKNKTKSVFVTDL